MDRQADSRSCGVLGSSGRVRFKYLLLSFGLFLGFILLRSAIQNISHYFVYVPKIFSNTNSNREQALMTGTLYIAGLSILQSLLAAPFFTVAALVYRAVNGIGAKSIGGFFGARVWLRSAAAYLPLMVINNIFRDCPTVLLPFFYRHAAGSMLVSDVLFAMFGCVYYGFAACDPMKNIRLGRIYGACLKRAVRRPVRLILTAVLLAGAHYLLFWLPFTALSSARLDTGIKAAAELTLYSLAPLVQSLIFYLIMLPRKKASAEAKDSGGLTGSEHMADDT